MNSKLNGLELLRFLAALAVVFAHIPSIGIGIFGVDIFFVISGFVMMLSTSNNSDNFMLKRIIRIVPLYWMATLGTFAIATVAPILLTSTDASLIDLAKSLFFIPFDKNGVGHQPIFGLGWTLNYEMYFYVLFSLSCLLSTRYRGCIVVGLVALNVLILDDFESFIAKTYSNLIVLEFGLGVVLYQITQKDKIQAMVALTLIGICALLSFEAGNRFFVFGMPASLIVFLFVYFGKNLPKSSLIPLLGGASYALYLSHFYIVKLFDRVLGLYGSENIIISVFSVVFSTLCCVFFAVFVFKYFENPILNYIRRKLIAI